MDSTANKVAPPFIQGISVQRLFGLYDYELTAVGGNDTPRLKILYGDNGSGKTTLLRLVFRLLSSARSSGHKRALAGVPFRRLAVTLADSLEVAAERDLTLLGAFRLKMIRRGEPILDMPLKIDANSRLVPLDGPPERIFDALQILANLHLNLHYLADDRRTDTSLLDREPVPQRLVESAAVVNASGRQRVESFESISVHSPGQDSTLPMWAILERKLREVEAVIRERVLTGSSLGDSNTNTIYTDIVQGIMNATSKTPTTTIEGTKRRLLELEDRARPFTAYGLLSPLHMGPLLEALDRGAKQNHAIVEGILTPYIDGLKARLDALAGVYELVDLLVGGINSFFKDKTMTFDIRGGIRIFSKANEELAAQMLSSGEQQLLLLFCVAILARERSTICFVDEPEISLNVKWQRLILDALLRCTTASPVQFVIATHSLELVARHLECVWSLDGSD